MVLRATQQLAEILYQPVGKLRATRQHIEILSREGKFGDLDNDLGLSDTILFLVHYGGFSPVSDSLAFTETIHLKGYEWVDDSIIFIDSTTGYGSIYKSLSHTIYFNDRIRAVQRYVTVTDAIDLTDIIPSYFSVELSDTLYFISTISRRDSLSDSIIFNQTIIVGKYRGFPVENLDLEQTIDVHGTWRRSIMDDFNINQAFTFYYNADCIEKEYHPFIGETGSLSSELPLIHNDSTSFTLKYPALGGEVESVTIRAPELSNVDRVSISRLNRETRGGNLVIFTDDDWPKINELQVSFIGLTAIESLALQNFIIKYNGKDILLTDWEGRDWIGIVTTPDLAIINDGRDNWSASFSFEGSLASSFVNGEALSLQETVSYTVVHP